jgi:hypothetical protein
MNEKLSDMEKTIEGFRGLLLPTMYVERTREGWQCLRRCRCGKLLITDGRGNFWCVHCEFEDYQDVSKLYEMGLDYDIGIHYRGVAGRAGKRSMMKEWS